MYTTPIAPPRKWIPEFVGKKVNLMEVPNLLHVPEEFHGLYTDIRKCRLVKEFSQDINKRTIELTLRLRDGEVCNYVVISRIAQLFKHHRAIITDRHDHLIVELYKTKRP